MHLCYVLSFMAFTSWAFIADAHNDLLACLSIQLGQLLCAVFLLLELGTGLSLSGRSLVQEGPLGLDFFVRLVLLVAAVGPLLQLLLRQEPILRQAPYVSVAAPGTGVGAVLVLVEHLVLRSGMQVLYGVADRCVVLAGGVQLGRPRLSIVLGDVWRPGVFLVVVL